MPGPGLHIADCTVLWGAACAPNPACRPGASFSTAVHQFLSLATRTLPHLRTTRTYCERLKSPPPPPPPPPPVPIEPVKSDPPGGGSCFPGAAVVQVAGHGALPMRQLAVGHRVLALDHATQRLAYKPVYLFPHQEQAALGPFLSLEVAPEPAGSNATTLQLHLSPLHFVPRCLARAAADCGAPRLPGLLDGLLTLPASWQYAYARDVRPGDWLLVAAPGASPGSDLVPAAVQRVRASMQQGLFNPFVEVRIAGGAGGTAPSMLLFGRSCLSLGHSIA